MADDPAPPALVLRTDRLRAARGVVVARQVALSASPGDVVAVEGVNGSGKSTLLAATAGLLPTSGGRGAQRAWVTPLNAPTYSPAWRCGAG
jgi:ABC-type Mn2+/Zn2+ transport system ATPase subunit